MKNEYTINKQEMMSWAKEVYFVGAASIVQLVLWIAVGLSGVGVLAFAAAVRASWIFWYVGVMLIFLAVFRLVISRYIIFAKRYNLLSGVYGRAEWTRSVEFLADEIVLTDHTAVSRVSYSGIRAIRERGRAVMIFFQNNTAIRIYKDAFTEGSWEECYAMLSAACAAQ